MLRSLMTAVTGVRAHQTMLDVVGNNVANVNTTGYKKSSTVFQDLLYQNSRGATAPGDARGGINPLQVGLGVQVAGVEMVNTAGPLQYTGQQTDVAISGNGYFVLTNGMEKLYTRAGNFSLDADGILDHVGTGFRVQGYGMEQDPANPANYISNGELGNMEIKIGSKIEAKATNNVGFRCNLDSRVPSYLPFGVTELNSDYAFAYTEGTGENAVELTRNGKITHDGEAGTTAGVFTAYSINIPGGTGTQPTPVQLQITGITNEGKPELALVGASTAEGVTNGTVSIAGSSDLVYYDDEFGQLQIRSATGAVKWTTNVYDDTSFQTFELEEAADPTEEGAVPTTYNVLLEVGEKMEDPVSGESAANVTMWIYDPENATEGNTPQHFTFSVPLNDDGTFNITETGLIIPGPADDTIPEPWDTRGFRLLTAADGLGFEIEASDGVKSATVATVTQNLAATHPVKFDVYDCKGVAHTLEVTYKKISNNNWVWEASFPNEPNLTATPSKGYLEFGPCGKLTSEPFEEIEVNYSNIGAFDETILLDFSGESFGYAVDDLEGITQYGSESTTKAYYQDGYAMGVLNEFSVAMDGTINGKYSNGKTIPLYKMALATFDNPMGLERVGNTAFAESPNSGLAQIGEPQVGGLGSTIGGNLEMSNVDIAEEFTRLILAQRGFQANTRIVTVSDSILEEAVNMKR